MTISSAVNALRRRLSPRRLLEIPFVGAELRPQSGRAVVMTGTTAVVAGVIIWSVYGVDLGYVGLASVYRAMTKVVNAGPGRLDDPAMQKNVRDQRVLNEFHIIRSGIRRTSGSSIPPSSTVSTFHPNGLAAGDRTAQAGSHT